MSSNDQPEPSPDASPKREANGYDDDADGEEIKVSFAPPKKKQRKEKSKDTEDADAKLAAMLQAEENSRSRATRGGGAKAKPIKKKAAPRKKSAKKVGPDDDSDVDGSDAPPKRKAGGGFQKPFNLSEPLAELCGETRVSALFVRLVSADELTLLVALSASGGEQAVGAYSKQRATGPCRQAQYYMRREDECRVQASQDQYVSDEQVYRRSSLPSRSRIEHDQGHSNGGYPGV